MATLWNLVLVVSLLALSAPQRCSGVDQGSLELRDVKLLAAMQVVSEALDCMTDTIKEGFQLQEKNNEELVLMVKEQLIVQNQDINSVKTQLADLKREDELSEEIAGLKKQLENRDNMVKAVTEENEDIKQQLLKKDERVRHLEQLVSTHTNTEQLLSNKVRHLEQLVSNHTNTEQLLSNKVQVLEKRITQYQEKEELEETLVKLNNTVAAHKNDTGSALERMPHRQEIIRLVQQYNNTKNWKSLWKGLDSVLDHSSEPYIQLQRLGYGRGNPVWHVAYYGYTQLVSLLLDAGLSVNVTDIGGHTLMYGAARGGKLELVKLLLDRGVNVELRNGIDRTPLMTAANYGQLEVVKLLVSAGADTTARNKERRTALDYAREKSHTAVVQYLEQLPH